jgi:hypothetical protein
MAAAGHPRLSLAAAVLERDSFSSNRHPTLAYCWSMIFSENRRPLFGIMLEGTLFRLWSRAFPTGAGMNGIPPNSLLTNHFERK